jgi:hypothetical protein
MSSARVIEDSARPSVGRAFVWDPVFLTRSAGALVLLARAKLSRIFIVDGAGERRRYTAAAPFSGPNTAADVAPGAKCALE